MGEAEEEAPLLPYFPHFRRLLRRAESFLLPSPCPVYTLAISYTEGPGRAKVTFWGEKAGGGKRFKVKYSGQKEDGWALVGWAQSPHSHRRNKNSHIYTCLLAGILCLAPEPVTEKEEKSRPRAWRRGSWETTVVLTHSRPMSWILDSLNLQLLPSRVTFLVTSCVPTFLSSLEAESMQNSSTTFEK